MPPTKPPTTNAINMKDVYTTTTVDGKVEVPLDNPCTVTPALTYARGQLTASVTVKNDTGASVTYPAGTTLKTVSVTPGTTKCVVQLSGPNNEALTNAPVLVYLAAFEQAR